MPDEHSLRAALPAFTGDILQVPPMASALKVGGKRLYDLRRRGVTLERESRPVTVHSFRMTSYDPRSQSATFEISCTGGTYVRSLISDLANHLCTGAYLTALRRTRVGHLRLENAVPPDELDPHTIQQHIIQKREVLAHLPVVEIGAEERRFVCNGRPLRGGAGEGSFRVEAGGELLAVYGGDGVEARPEVVLCGE